MRAGDKGRVGGLGEEGILIDIHVLGTEILDQSRIDYHSSRSEGTRFKLKASTKFAANLSGYLLVYCIKPLVVAGYHATCKSPALSTG